MKKKVDKNLIIFFGVILVMLLFLILNNVSMSGYITAKKEVPEIKITYQNLEKVFSGNSIIKSLPENSYILLKFYSGEKIEKSYIISKGSVKEGSLDKADIILFIDLKYIDELTNKNFCSIIKKARDNGDLRIQTELSTIKLLWKFKGILKYRGCLGF